MRVEGVDTTGSSDGFFSACAELPDVGARRTVLVEASFGDLTRALEVVVDERPIDPVALSSAEPPALSTSVLGERAAALR